MARPLPVMFAIVAPPVRTCFSSPTPMKPANKIVDIAFNGAGVRDTARVLKIGINTVLRALKNSPQGK